MPRPVRPEKPGSPRILIAAALAGGLVAVTACTSNPPRSSAPGSTTGTTIAVTGSAADLQQAYVAVVSKVRPEVVQITTSTGVGSGVVYDTSGDIVTNAHVVGTETAMTVQFSSGQKLPATLVGAYAPDDLAVVRVTGARDLTAATFGTSRGVQVGEMVLAIGNPLGLSSSVTDGIVSYNGRSVSEGNGVTLPSTIQTSAAINPGNSGGALVDLHGQVIGIPTLGVVNQQEGGTAAGIGFAVPSDTVKLIVPQLISTGRVTRTNRAALGVTAADAVSSSGAPAGVQVVQVQSGGSAERAGIAAGEVITSVNGQPVTSLADLQAVLAGLTPGQTATVVLLDQNGDRRSVSAVLGELSG